MVLKLPKNKSTPATKLRDFVILIYGREKIGKTTLASLFPKAFFLMFEPGGKDLELFQKPVSSWKRFRSWIDAIEKDDDYDTIVIDTIDVCFLRCEEYVCKKVLHIEHPSDEEWGKGWSIVRNRFEGEIDRLLNIGKGVIFISHATEKEIKLRGGFKSSVIVPTMANQASKVINPKLDIWCYYGFEDNERYLWINGNELISAGTRLENHFLNSKGERIDKVPMGNSKEISYKNFIRAFNNKPVKINKIKTK